MKEWFETIFAALKTWQAGAVLCLSVTGNIYQALWLRQEITEGKEYLKIVISTKTESNDIKSGKIQDLEEEVSRLRRALRDTAQ